MSSKKEVASGAREVTSKKPALRQENSKKAPARHSSTHRVSNHNRNTTKDTSTQSDNTYNNKSNTKKRSFEQIDWQCHESMPPMVVFSRYQPERLLPYQLITAAYTIVKQCCSDNKNFKEQGDVLNSHELHKWLRRLLPFGASELDKNEESNKKGHDDEVQLQQQNDTSLTRSATFESDLRKIPEIIRMQSFGFSIEPLLELPLSFDWSSLGLGQTTGSAAFNQYLLQRAAKDSKNGYDIMVPQLSSEEFYMAVQESIRTPTTSLPPPSDHVAQKIYQQLVQLDTTSTTMTHTKSARQMQEMLQSLHTRAEALQERWNQFGNVETDSTTTSTESEEEEEEEEENDFENSYKDDTSSHWSTILPSLLIQEGYNNPQAFCAPHDTLY